MKPYWEKLKDPRWQRKRLEVMQRDDFKCVWCKSDDSELHVHHGFYRRGAEPWEHDDGELWTLCRKCHDHATQLDECMRSVIGRMRPSQIYILFFIVAAFKRHIQKIDVDPADFGEWADAFDPFIQSLPQFESEIVNMLNKGRIN